MAAGDDSSQAHCAPECTIAAGSGAFNIKAKSLRLGDLDEEDVRALLDQHTEETGQEFTEGALAAVWNLSRGQPWLVNALAYQACFETRAARDRSRTIDEEAIMDAREELVLGRQTHLHQLADKLREERGRRAGARNPTGTSGRTRCGRSGCGGWSSRS